MADDSGNGNNPFADATVIFSYTRAMAIADGVLIDVTETAREAGFKFPVAVSEAVWRRYVEFDPKSAGQDKKGRLWDVLWMLRVAIKRGRDGDTTLYQLYVALSQPWRANERPPRDLDPATHRLVTLKAVCGPGDDPKPVITIMLPDED